MRTNFFQKQTVVTFLVAAIFLIFFSMSAVNQLASRKGPPFNDEGPGGGKKTESVINVLS